jgi:hypothetical protein
MPRWPHGGQTPLEDMRIPLTSPMDLERLESFVDRARKLGLATITFVVLDEAPAPWLPAVLAAVRKAGKGRLPDVQVAIEGRIVSDEGHISVPALPHGVDKLYITLDRLPLGMLCVSPMELREAFEEGRTSAMSIVRRTVEVLRAAMRRNPGIVLTRPFALLSAVGIPEEWVSPEALRVLANDALTHGVSLQVDEWERSPRTMATEVFASAGVPLLFGTGARDAEDVGLYDYIGRMVCRIPALAEDLVLRDHPAAFTQGVSISRA